MTWKEELQKWTEEQRQKAPPFTKGPGRFFDCVRDNSGSVPYDVLKRAEESVRRSMNRPK